MDPTAVITTAWQLLLSTSLLSIENLNKHKRLEIAPQMADWVMVSQYRDESAKSRPWADYSPTQCHTNVTTRREFKPESTSIWKSSWSIIVQWKAQQKAAVMLLPVNPMGPYFGKTWKERQMPFWTPPSCVFMSRCRVNRFWFLVFGLHGPWNGWLSDFQRHISSQPLRHFRVVPLFFITRIKTITTSLLMSD